jgi:hypothetical protein
MLKAGLRLAKHVKLAKLASDININRYRSAL